MVSHAMTLASVASMVVTAFDLLALTTCIGILGFRLWVVPVQDDVPPPAADFLKPLWRLLGLCLAMLTLSSIGELIRRAIEMSGQPIEAFPVVLPAVLSGTHFGRVWLLRPFALLVLWIGWRLRPNLGPARVSAAMLAGACLIAASRSLSGHAADWGDITLPELMDWSHLLAASFWGGSLIALTVTGFSNFSERPDARRQVIVAMARRWSSLAGAALAVVALTGIYNAWLELQRFQALGETAYGRLLLFKLSLVLAIVVLGAANRYLGLPALRAWAGGSPDDRGPASLPSTMLAFLARDRTQRERRAPLARFIHRARLEGVFMIGTVLCVAVLVSLMPARHAARMPSGQHSHTHGAGH